MHTHDTIVIGIGGVGSGVVDALSRRGVSVLGLEQFGPAHDHGSSHGETRIIRKAYFEHPDYVPLLHRAFDGWRELEAEAGYELLRPTGLFLCGPADGEAIGGTIRAADAHRLPLDRLTPQEARQRFPGFVFPDENVILCEQQAGYLHVERCVQTQIETAIQHGADLRFGERVIDWKADAAGVTVTTDRETYSAGSLVIAAGPWAGQLLSQLGMALRVLRKVQFWFGIPANSYQRSPCFYFEHEDGAYYGIPSPDGETIKVAEHSGEEVVDDPLHVDRECHARDVARVESFVKTELPMVRPGPVRHSVCMYTMSPDRHFIVDRHPELSNVHFAAGLSGHGFKFTRVLGEALADCVIDGTTKLPVGFLQLGRFASVDEHEMS